MKFIDIDFDSLKDEDKSYIDLFLSTQNRRKAFHTGTPYRIGKTDQYIRFNREVIPYQRENREWGYNVYSATKQLGKGAFGVVREVQGKIVFRGRWNYEQFDKDLENEQQRALKELEINQLNPLEDLKLESDLLQMAPHAHAKPIYVEDDTKIKKGYISQRFFKGEKLTTILSATYSNPLTTDERVQLSINLLLALKNQMHDKGLLHRDIKPDNIIVDRKTLAVKIIDVGLGRPLDKEDHKATGTPHYVAPELLKSTSFVESDLFSMGLVLLEVWKGKSWRANEKQADIVSYLKEDAIKKIGIDALWLDDANNLFDQINDLDKKHAEKITEQLKKVFSLNIDARGSITDSANLFNRIKKERSLSVLHSDEIAKQSRKIERAYQIGEHLSADIKKMNEKSILNDSKALMLLQNFIHDALIKLDAKSDLEINAFIEASNINVFKKMKFDEIKSPEIKASKQEINATADVYDLKAATPEDKTEMLHEKVTDIFSSFKENLKTLSSFKLELELDKEMLSLLYPPQDKLFLHLQYLDKETVSVANKINKSKHKVDLDDIAELNKHLQKRMKTLQGDYTTFIAQNKLQNLENVRSQLKDLQMETDDKELNQSRKEIFAAIKNYMSKSDSSGERVDDIKQLIKIIHDKNKVTDLKKSINDYLESMPMGFFGHSRFGSQLFRLVKAVIDKPTVTSESTRSFSIKKK